MTIILTKKQLATGVIYPSKLAKSFIKQGGGAKTILNKVNKGLGGEYTNYKETKDVFSSIKKEAKNIKSATIGLRDKYNLALTNIIASAVINKVTTDNQERKKAIWLPSGSNNPSLIHMKNYGEEFYLDEGIDGELPGQRYNCQCGMRLL